MLPVQRLKLHTERRKSLALLERILALGRLENYRRAMRLPAVLLSAFCLLTSALPLSAITTSTQIVASITITNLTKNF
jgi:hypothetical protein